MGAKRKVEISRPSTLSRRAGWRASRVLHRGVARDRAVLKLRHDLRGQYLHLALMLVAGVEQDVIDTRVDEAPEPLDGLRRRRCKPNVALITPRVLIAECSVQLLSGLRPVVVHCNVDAFGKPKALRID